MDFTHIEFIGLVVITVIGALKDQFPQVTGNMTRLMALVIGALIGFLAQVGLLPGINDVTLVTGIMAGVAAVGTVTVADRIAVGTTQNIEYDGQGPQKRAI